MCFFSRSSDTVKNDVPNAVKFPLDTTSPSCCNWNIIDDDAFACKNVNSLFLAFGSPLVSASNAAQADIGLDMGKTYTVVATSSTDFTLKDPSNNNADVLLSAGLSAGTDTVTFHKVLEKNKNFVDARAKIPISPSISISLKILLNDV